MMQRSLLPVLSLKAVPLPRVVTNVTQTANTFWGHLNCTSNLRPVSETGWDLGPGTLCCRAGTWTNVS